jgi:hypothetical protein
MSTDLKQLGARRGFTSANEGSPETCADRGSGRMAGS